MIWGNINETRIWPIFQLQKLAIRLIFNIKRRESTSASFKKENILKVPDIYKYVAIIFMFKKHRNMLPDQFNDLFVQNSAIHEHNTRRSQHLHIPIFKTGVGNLFITKTGVILWNEIKEKGYDTQNLGFIKVNNSIRDNNQIHWLKKYSKFPTSGIRFSFISGYRLKEGSVPVVGC